jgi:hypothetical protein
VTPPVGVRSPGRCVVGLGGAVPDSRREEIAKSSASVAKGAERQVGVVKSAPSRSEAVKPRPSALGSAGLGRLVEQRSHRVVGPEDRVEVEPACPRQQRVGLLGLPGLEVTNGLQ